MITVGNTTFLKIINSDTISVAETSNVYSNASGHTIIYPIRAGQRKMTITAELDSETIHTFVNLFSAATVEIYGLGIFRKVSDISVAVISYNAVISPSIAIDGVVIPAKSGVYTATVQLEEM